MRDAALRRGTVKKLETLTTADGLCSKLVASVAFDGEPVVTNGVSLESLYAIGEKA